MLEADGVDAGAEGLFAAVAEPPQAVRLSRAAAAIPATVKVVRLNDCISILLVSADHCLRRTTASITALALFRLWAPTLGWCLNGYSAVRLGRMGNREKYSSVARPGACNEALNDGIPSREARDSGVLLLCARGDLNPHARRHRNLNPACLPISPLARGAVVDCFAAVHAKRTRRSTAVASLQCTFRDVPSARC
jgi:hypothetical protein